MNNLQKITLCFLSLTCCADVFTKEIGRHDGGDYAFWTPGSKDGKIYPTSDQKKNLVDTYYDECNCEIHRDVFVEKMDFDKVRAQFPIFKQTVNGYPLIFLDSASSAQMPQSVLDAVVAYYHDFKSNAGRGIYDFAAKTTELFEEARAKVAHFIGAKKQEIVFTAGTTAGINLVAQAWADHMLQPGDEIIVSEMEHNANFLPWQQLALRKNLTFTIVPVNEKGIVELGVLQKYLSSKTKLVAVTQQSNVTGSTNDIQAITKVAHEVGAKVLVDAAQSIVHQKINVRSLDCDFLAFSAHKLYGPTGVGALFIKENLFDQLHLQNFGGGMVYEVGEKDSEFKDMPHCMEAGTQPIAQVIGFGAAVDFVKNNINFTQEQAHETALVKSFTEQLQEIPGITIISATPDADEHNNMVVFISDDCHAYDIAEYLNQYGIAVRAGYHCVHLYHEKLGGRASVRVSFSIYNNQKEVDFLIERLKTLLVK